MIAKLKAFADKVITWIKMNFATVFGLLQSVLDAIKEILTGLINLFSIFMFTDAAEAFIMKVRGWLNVVDGWLQKAKDWLLINVVNK